MKPIIKQDNTAVSNPPLINPIMRQLRQGEAYINDQGKKIIVKNNNQSIQPDYRTPSDRVKAQRKFKEREKEQREVKEKEALSGFFTFIAPSTYIGPVFNSNNKSYTENVISGEGTGNAEANLTIDMLAPFGVGGGGKNLRWFLKHPGATKVYHVNRLGQTFDLRDARTASSTNIGLHVTPDVNISKTFNQNAPVMSAYIPRPNAETIDLGANDYHLLSNSLKLQARNGTNFYDAAGEPNLFQSLLQKYGAEPTKIGNRIYTKNSVSIPLRDETFPKLTIKDKQEADDIISQGGKFNFLKNDENKYIKLNQKANDILSNRGYKVIKYINTNPSEVRSGSGISYMVTDPKVFYVPKSNSNQILQSINILKYNEND